MYKALLQSLYKDKKKEGKGFKNEKKRERNQRRKCKLGWREFRKAIEEKNGDPLCVLTTKSSIHIKQMKC